MATLSFKCQSTWSKLSQMWTFSNCSQPHLALVFKMLSLTTIGQLHEKTCAKSKDQAGNLHNLISVLAVCSIDQVSIVGQRRLCDIENNRWVSFDIKFTRQGFENACWHREACRATQHAFSKRSLLNLISKDTNLVFYLSVYSLFHSSY